VAERDSIDGWPCCINCGRPTPDGGIEWSNAHYISRAQGGLGIEENVLTLCPDCHRRYDQTTKREEMREYFKCLFLSTYDDWDETKLVYQKGR
jgi:5-methylcytosine-specific restriction endonuclease McrA